MSEWNEAKVAEERKELETTKEDLLRMPDGMHDEVNHLTATIDLALEAIDKGWYRLVSAHRETIAVGMDIIFDRLSSQ